MDYEDCLICSMCEHLMELETREICMHKEAKEFHNIFGNSWRNNQLGVVRLGRKKAGPIKFTPKWCPIKNKYNIIEITRKHAYRVISTGLPHGCFFVREGKIVTGLLNIGDEPEIEEFGTEKACKRWLTERIKNEQHRKCD